MPDVRELFRWPEGRIIQHEGDPALYWEFEPGRVTPVLSRIVVTALLARVEALEGALREADDLVTHPCFRPSDPKTKPRREIDRAGEYVTRWRSLLDPEAPDG